VGAILSNPNRFDGQVVTIEGTVSYRTYPRARLDAAGG